MRARVIISGSVPIATNDADDRYIVCISRAHAVRVVKWLGLTGISIRQASVNEIAQGALCQAHCVPNWATPSVAAKFGGNTTPSKIIAFAVAIGLSLR